MPSHLFTEKKRTEIAYIANTEGKAAAVKAFGCSYHAVTLAINRGKENEGEQSQANRRRSGRPRILSDRDDRHIKRLSKQERRATPTQLRPALSSTDINISHNTIRSSWKRTGINRNEAKERPPLSAEHRKKRRLWAEEYKEWDFRRGIYCDEASMDRQGKGDIWISMEKGEENLPECLLPKFPQGGGSMMIWGAIWHGGRSTLVRFDCSESTSKKGGVTAVIYRDQVVKGPLLDAWRRMTAWWRPYGGNVLILQDGAGPHKGAARREEDRLGMRFMNHPPYSPDLNPIEHCWAWMRKEVRKQARMPENMDKLWELLQTLWAEMPQEVIDNCVDKLFDRRRVVEARRGLHADNL